MADNAASRTAQVPSDVRRDQGGWSRVTQAHPCLGHQPGGPHSRGRRCELPGTRQLRPHPADNAATWHRRRRDSARRPAPPRGRSAHRPALRPGRHLVNLESMCRISRNRHSSAAPANGPRRVPCSPHRAAPFRHNASSVAAGSHVPQRPADQFLSTAPGATPAYRGISRPAAARARTHPVSALQSSNAANLNPSRRNAPQRQFLVRRQATVPLASTDPGDQYWRR